MPLRGYSWPGRPAIFLLAGLGPGRTAWVAAHETAHVADEPGKPDAEAGRTRLPITCSGTAFTAALAPSSITGVVRLKDFTP